MPDKGATKDASQIFLDQGITGAVALLAIGALIWVTRQLFKEKDQRLQDQKSYSEVLRTVTDGVKSLTIEVNKSTTEMTVGTSATLKALKESVDKMEDAVDGVRDQQVRLEAAITSSVTAVSSLPQHVASAVTSAMKD